MASNLILCMASNLILCTDSLLMAIPTPLKLDDSEHLIGTNVEQLFSICLDSNREVKVFVHLTLFDCKIIESAWRGRLVNQLHKFV